MPDTAQWDGRTYYGRPQLKPAPFNNVLVGSYVFLAGLSGAAQVLGTALDCAAIPGAEPIVRRGRLLSLLAPTIGTVCLIFDLHTPKRFYNMLRLVKATSPMSLGSWALVAFSGASVAAAAPRCAPQGLAGKWLAARLSPHGTDPGSFGRRRPRHLHGIAVFGHKRSALGSRGKRSRGAICRRIHGVGRIRVAPGSTRRTPAAGPRHCRGCRPGRELAAILASDRTQQGAGVRNTASSRDIAGVAVPLGLFLASHMLPRRAQAVSQVAAAAALAGSLFMRIGVIRDGEQSAERPDVSMRFAQPE